MLELRERTNRAKLHEDAAAAAPPFASALFELSCSNRRWKFEATHVLSDECRALEARVLALEAEVDTAAARSAEAVRAAEERVRLECEERSARERDELLVALRDAQARTAHYERALEHAARSMEAPPPPW